MIPPELRDLRVVGELDPTMFPTGGWLVEHSLTDKKLRAAEECGRFRLTPSGRNHTAIWNKPILLGHPR